MTLSTIPFIDVELVTPPQSVFIHELNYLVCAGSVAVYDTRLLPGMREAVCFWSP